MQLRSRRQAGARRRLPEPVRKPHRLPIAPPGSVRKPEGFRIREPSEKDIVSHPSRRDRPTPNSSPVPTVAERTPTISVIGGKSPPIRFESLFAEWGERSDPAV